jgi:hypothetical protein
LLPDFLDIDREVTDEPGWGNYDLARAFATPSPDEPALSSI